VLIISFDEFNCIAISINIVYSFMILECSNYVYYCKNLLTLFERICTAKE